MEIFKATWSKSKIKMADLILFVVVVVTIELNKIILEGDEAGVSSAASPADQS